MRLNTTQYDALEAAVREGRRVVVVRRGTEYIVIPETFRREVFQVLAFPDQAMTLASIDRLVHHATILEMNVESYRRRAALDRKRAKKTEPSET